MLKTESSWKVDVEVEGVQTSSKSRVQMLLWERMSFIASYPGHTERFFFNVI